MRVRHVARALVELPDTRAREAMLLEKLDVPAASTALDALRESDEAPEPVAVLVLRKAGTFGKSGNPLTRKFTSWIFGGGAGFGSRWWAWCARSHSAVRYGAGRRRRNPSMCCWASWRWTGRWPSRGVSCPSS